MRTLNNDRNVDQPKSILITGASSGIGAATALELARRGFRVFAGVRTPDGIAHLHERAPTIVPIELDVTRAESIAVAVQQVEQIVGGSGLAGLVNNAGVVVAGPLEVLPINELRRQFEVNLFGLIAVTQAFLPLVRCVSGRIVNIGSVNGRLASPYLGPYCASKHALEAMTTALRTELRTWNIEVSLIEPGSTATPIWEKTFAESKSLAEHCDADKYALYANDLDAMAKATRELAKNALGVETVVMAVVHALTASRPRTRYPIGLGTNLLLRAIKWIPDRIFDRLVQRTLKLPQSSAEPGSREAVESRQRAQGSY